MRAAERNPPHAGSAYIGLIWDKIEAYATVIICWEDMPWWRKSLSRPYVHALSTLWQQIINIWIHFKIGLKHNTQLQLFKGLTNLVSSTNFSTVLDRPLSKSLIKMRNKIGPNIDPCGTPLHTGLHLEYLPSRRTRCCRSVTVSQNHALIRLQTKPSIPWAFNFKTRRSCVTLSKALVASCRSLRR